MLSRIGGQKKYLSSRILQICNSKTFGDILSDLSHYSDIDFPLVSDPRIILFESSSNMLRTDGTPVLDALDAQALELLQVMQKNTYDFPIRSSIMIDLKSQ